MECKGTLKISRGSREVARARGSRNPRNEIRATTNRFSNSNHPGKGRSRVKGHVGVAVRRGDTNSPVPTYDDRSGDDDDDDDDGAYSPFVDQAQGPSLYGSRQANDYHPSPTALAGPPTNYVDGATIDLTEDNPQPAAGEPTSSVDFDDPSATQAGRSYPTPEKHSLASWLVPAVPSPEIAAGKGKKRPRKQPLREADSISSVSFSSISSGKRSTWASTLSQERGGSSRARGRGGGEDTLSAWLEPSPSRKKSRTRLKEDEAVHSAAVGDGSSGLLGYEDDDPGDENDSGKWMSDRLEGLDPSGAARAKDSWTDRERRNLTCTDIALGAKRKGRGGPRRGWKTKAGGSKVFVENGGGVVASGRAAYRKSKRGGGGGGGGGGARKKGRG